MKFNANLGTLLSIAIDTPAHSRVGALLTWRSESTLAPGTLVRVPLGRREVLGVVWEPAPEAAARLELETREIAGELPGLEPLSAEWRRLVAFAAGYYQRSVGEVALAALPPQLRELTAQQLSRRLKRPPGTAAEGEARDTAPVLTAQQAAA